MLCSYLCVFIFQTKNAEGVHVPLSHQLLRVIVRVLQYRMLLTGEHCVSVLEIVVSKRLYLFTLYKIHVRTIFLSFTFFPDYLNNLSPDSKEYEDTQGIVVLYSSLHTT